MLSRQSEDDKVWISWGKVKFLLGVRYYSIPFSIFLWAGIVWTVWTLLDLHPYANALHLVMVMLIHIVPGAVIFVAEVGFTTALEKYLYGKWTKINEEEIHIFCDNTRKEEEASDV